MNVMLEVKHGDKLISLSLSLSVTRAHTHTHTQRLHRTLYCPITDTQPGLEAGIINPVKMVMVHMLTPSLTTSLEMLKLISGFMAEEFQNGLLVR